MTTHTSISILGAGTDKGQRLLAALSDLDINILLAAHGEEEHAVINDLLTRIKPRAVVEVQQCAREGCWEADIILLFPGMAQMKELSDAIRDVVTQKTVVVFEEMNGMQEYLPFSKIVKATIDDRGFSLESMDEEALLDVEELFQAAGLGLHHKKEFSIT